MIIFKTADGLRKWLEKQRNTGKTIGFVPTMGALHNGHLSLISNSQKHRQVTVCSIFVNPAQFNDPKDFAKYPVTIESDCQMLEKTQTDVLFLPSVDEIYPSGIVNNLHYDLGHLEDVLDGAYRPGHFQGVCQVVELLLNIVQPHELFLGQKDFQQCMVIKKLVDIMAAKNNNSDRNTPNMVTTITPTLREKDGLAMSSRNMRLNPEARQAAPAIHQQLSFIRQNLGLQEINDLKSNAVRNLLLAGFSKVDYVEIASVDTLEPIKDFDPNKNTVALVAAFINDVRLIDNMLLN